MRQCELVDVVDPAVPHADVDPEFTFKARTLRLSDDGWTLDGELTVVGVTQPVTLAIRSLEAAVQDSARTPQPASIGTPSA